MARTASAYERELKGLLQADPDSLARYGGALEPDERSALLPRFARHPFLVIRGAGSLGFDLVALRREFSFPIEVKSSRQKAIHFSAAGGRAADQLREYRRAVDQVGLLAIYAFRRVGLRAGDPWRIFTPSAPLAGGRLELIRRRLPPVDRTRDGGAVLRWENGLPLARFLDLVTSLVEGTAG